jgi:hypothetical protein
VPEQRLPGGILDDRAVAGDEREGPWQLLEHRPRKVVPPAGRQHDLDARLDRAGQRGPVRGRKVPPAVEQRAVDVERDQPDGVRDACCLSPD